MPQSKIALCMIVKNGRDLFEECLRNVSKVVDEIVVIIDDKSEDGCDEVAKSFGAKVLYRPLAGDFASQRNFSYDQVSDDIDWYLWLDSDDRVSEESAARIRVLADKGLEEDIDGFLFDYQYAFDATGRPTTVLKRERLLRKSLGWRWKYEIHEVCVAPDGVEPHMVYDPGVVVKHRKHEMPKQFAKPRRNLDIVERVIGSYQNDVRMLFYAANEYLAYGDNKNAQKYYRKVLKQKNSWSEQRFLAALRMGYMAFDKDNFDEAEEWGWRATQIDPRWAEAWCLLGDVASERKNWRMAAHFYGFAMNTPIPKDVLMTYNPASYTWYPAGKRAAALQNMGEYEESLKSIDSAIQFQPKDRSLRIVKNHIVQQMAEHRRDGLEGVLLVAGPQTDVSMPMIRMLALARGLAMLGVKADVVEALDGKNHEGKMCVVLRGDSLPPLEIVSVIRSGRTDVIVDFCGPQELLFNKQYSEILKNTNLTITNSPRLVEQLRGVVPDRVKYIPDPSLKEYDRSLAADDGVSVLVVSPDEAAAGARLLPLLQEYPQVRVKFLSPSEFSSQEWSFENLDGLTQWAQMVLLYDDRDDEAAGAGLLTHFMASGLPVVAAAVPATVSVVDHGKSGLLCYTAREWETYVKILVENKNNERERMGVNARLRARRFGPKSFADRWCDFTGIPTESVDVIIPCHGKNDLVRACLANIQKASLPSTRVIVVANPQNANATEELKGIVSDFDGAILEEQDFPRSFAANCNVGIACSTAEYVSLLNNDTLVSKGWDAAMLRTISENGGRCIVSALSNGDFGWHYEEPISIGEQELRARHEPGEFPRGFDLKVLESGDSMRERYGSKGAQEVEWVSFAGVMMPRSVFGEVGDIDEKFENGVEDFDFCMRFKKAGGKCFYDWTSFIFHYCGSTRDEVYGTEEESEKRRMMQLRNDLILTEKRKRNEMTVRFFVGPPLENWLPEDIGEKGLGGSETCVAMAAKELAALGWEVHVYSTEFEVATMRQGVIYRPWSQFDPWERTDVLIVSRVPSVFDEPILNARLKILYNHDATYGDEESRSYPSEERVKNIDHLFVLSEWHKQAFMTLYPHIPEKKFVVTRNGVDMRRFERQRRGRIPKDAKRFVYSHSANRGLEELLAMWPNIMRMDPGMRLHVYYGFDTWLKMAEKSGDTSSIERMKAIVKACDQPGVMLHSRVGQDQLAEEIGMANLALYPTHFHETSCITAMEYALGNTQMITSPIGALTETAFSAKFIDKPYMSEDYQREFLEALRTAINEPNISDRKAAAQKTREIYDWRNIILEWDSFFLSNLEGADPKLEKTVGDGPDISILMPYGAAGGVLYPQDLANEWQAMGLDVAPWMVRFRTEESEEVDSVLRTVVHVVDARNVPQIKDAILNSKVIVATNWQTVMLVNGLLQGDDRRPLLYNLVQGDETKWVNPEAISALLSDERWNIVYVSNYLASRFAIPGDLVANGIDLDVFSPEASEGNGVPKKETAIGFIDHASPMKNTAILRAILGDMSSETWLPNERTSVSVVMASPELRNDEEMLEGQSTDKNSVFAYPGPITKSEVAHIMSMCGIWLVPSLEEGFGLVPLEAMACGAIPIVSGVGGMRMYCRDGENCIVVNDPTDPEEWLARIAAVLEMSEEDRRRIREAGIATAAEFSIGAAARKLRVIFNRDGFTKEASHEQE